MKKLVISTSLSPVTKGIAVAAIESLNIDNRFVMLKWTFKSVRRGWQGMIEPRFYIAFLPARREAF
ncbi:MAG: hypothetical protein A2W01_08140 [Candidatus Solincola sediminis]|uniref:Uncharacterized protein n=1 Tax=Candidatus Solincola sediminis TaxID=1797199 RepID=A0A1F2WSG2_9ACTN|nr:MAG: hypothetical protein A2Y75_04815 [Candidatus Solincola sediminis]OFW61627.1 MAG: hypothetical protein A2W01_08140 [Candidatus Solincola sediminis]